MRHLKHLRDLMIAMVICGGFLIVFGAQMLIFLTGHTIWGRIAMGARAIIPGVMLIWMGIYYYVDALKESRNR